MKEQTYKQTGRADRGSAIHGGEGASRERKGRKENAELRSEEEERK